MQLRQLQLLRQLHNPECESGQEVGKKCEFHLASSYALLAILILTKCLLTEMMRKLYTSKIGNALC